jgi:hypothetical protein
LRKAAQIGGGHEDAQFLDPVHRIIPSISISETGYGQLQVVGCGSATCSEIRLSDSLRSEHDLAWIGTPLR